jgi:phosphosulfolactate synthase
MSAELEAGAWKVIGEAREGGNIGLYRSSGEVRQGLVDEIIHAIDADNIIWEAPQKSQQVYFVKLVGSDVNLGNIAPNEVIPLETIRLGLRGDTFDTFLPEEEKKNFKLGKYYEDDRIRHNNRG